MTATPSDPHDARPQVRSDATHVWSLPSVERRPEINYEALAQQLRDTLGGAWQIVDPTTSRALAQVGDPPTSEPTRWLDALEHVAQRGEPLFLEDEAPLVVLAVPHTVADGPTCVGLGWFLTRGVDAEADVTRAAH